MLLVEGELNYDNYIVTLYVYNNNQRNKQKKTTLSTNYNTVFTENIICICVVAVTEIQKLTTFI